MRMSSDARSDAKAQKEGVANGLEPTVVSVRCNLQRVSQTQCETAKLQHEITLLKEENKQLNSLNQKLIDKVEAQEAEELTEISTNLKLR